mgnify:CR=1 FL=1
MSQPNSIPLVDVSGSIRERGRQHGEGARERVLGSVALYTEQLGDIGFSKTEVDALVEEFLPRMEDWAPDLIEEMRGIAEGAGCGLHDVALVNARTEVLQLAHRQKGVSEEEPDGCTGALILPEATRDGNLIHGQNWDWRAECAETSIVLRIRRDDGPDILTYTEAGGLARSGFNSAGLAITANYLECERDYRELGIPLPLIRRRALEAQHFAMALKVIAITPKSGSNNMMMSTAEGYGIDLECAPDEAFPLYPENGLIVHANHWLSPTARVKVKETGIEATPDSLYRDARVAGHLTPRLGKITAADLKTALFDSFASPYAVCRPPLPNKRGNLSATVAMIVMEPALGRLEVAPLPAINDTFTTYTLEMDEGVRAAA